MTTDKSTTGLPLPLRAIDAEDESFILRALGFATGYTNPFQVTVWSWRSEEWPHLVAKYVGTIAPSRRNYEAILGLCEARHADLRAHLGTLDSSPNRVAALAVDGDAAWAPLLALALRTEHCPALLSVLDVTGVADLEGLAELFSYVLELPPGDVEDALVRLDDQRPRNWDSLREGAVDPSSIIRLILAS